MTEFASASITMKMLHQFAHGPRHRRSGHEVRAAGRGRWYMKADAREVCSCPQQTERCRYRQVEFE